MNLMDAVAVLEKAVPNPTAGLPDDVFYYISRTTPLINVDLLIKDEKGRTLLAWRDDQFCGAGWHIPGGIIRFKETMETRIQKVAEREIGCQVEYDPAPIKITEMIHQFRADRAHFISLLINCRIFGGYEPENAGIGPGMPGHLRWHDTCPDDLIRFHHVYYQTYI